MSFPDTLRAAALAARLRAEATPDGLERLRLRALADTLDAERRVQGQTTLPRWTYLQEHGLGY